MNNGIVVTGTDLKEPSSLLCVPQQSSMEERVAEYCGRLFEGYYKSLIL